ncbi:MAG: hypothetical protein DSM107014_03000 [Gomphosphaeria aponina SAG 52.96 = DSM 107014]|uniref:Uncharacterized protein n=1 Tax=Gomphosphaeria aponina SAG 52.96 = DSM 107014 TaxID=1521640 RepID=A0A941GNW2_9CHRO|nr:hypothetical protein [Gomphosphaeria aponina SAG 52.96 = DSM 107014]
MDITESTKKLIRKVQELKAKYSDLASVTFIDFYSQYHQGCDYLFPPQVKNSVRLLDILLLFCQCVELKTPSLLTKLMWKDVIGPTLGEYQEDEQIEETLTQTLANQELQNAVNQWDREPRIDGGVNLILRNLLHDIEEIETEHFQQ